MIKIFFLKSLFVPTLEFIEANKNSIKSLFIVINSLDRTKFKISLRFEGWINKTILSLLSVNDIVTFIQKVNIHNDDVHYNFYDNNYGKCYTLKNNANIINHDYIFYADHDIIFSDSISAYLNDIVVNNMTPFNSYYNEKQVLLVSFNQQLDIRHNYYIYSSHVVINNMPYHISDKTNKHIATGCFICINLNLCNDIQTDYIYGNEDIQIGGILDLINGLNIVPINVFIIHPFNNNKKYNLWKTNQILHILSKKS